MVLPRPATGLPAATLPLLRSPPRPAGRVQALRLGDRRLLLLARAHHHGRYLAGVLAPGQGGAMPQALRAEGLRAGGLAQHVLRARKHARPYCCPSAAAVLHASMLRPAAHCTAPAAFFCALGPLAHTPMPTYTSGAGLPSGRGERAVQAARAQGAGGHPCRDAAGRQRCARARAGRGGAPARSRRGLLVLPAAACISAHAAVTHPSCIHTPLSLPTLPPPPQWAR